MVEPPPDITPSEIYSRLGAEWEHYDNLIWQVTATSATFAVGATGLALGVIHDLLMRGAILVVASLVLWILRVGLAKHVYFLRTRAEQLQALEEAHFGGRVVQRWTVSTSKPSGAAFFSGPVPAKASRVGGTASRKGFGRCGK